MLCALQCLIEKVNECTNSDQAQEAYIVFIDYSKAFDNVSVWVVIKKNMWISSKLKKWGWKHKTGVIEKGKWLCYDFEGLFLVVKINESIFYLALFKGQSISFKMM